MAPGAATMAAVGLPPGPPQQTPEAPPLEPPQKLRSSPVGTMMMMMEAVEAAEKVKVTVVWETQEPGDVKLSMSIKNGTTGKMLAAEAGAALALPLPRAAWKRSSPVQVGILPPAQEPQLPSNRNGEVTSQAREH